MEDVVFKNKELAQKEDKVNYYEDLIPVVKKYEAIIRSIKKVILNVAYRYDFQKNQKRLGKWSTIYFKSIQSWKSPLYHWTSLKIILKQ